MATVRPFRAVRYPAPNISKLICPPYDVISPGEKKRLLKGSPANMVRLELPDASGGLDKYRAASRLFDAWRMSEVLARDEAPAFYFYEQVFKDHGVRMVRRGFFAALKLENPHGGAVKPHERTLKKPKEDRLKLLRAVRANLSPIFGLFDDRGGTLVRFAKKVASRRPLSTAKDKEGTAHRLWSVNDPAGVKAVEKALAGRKIFIADGHHRYETAWNYSQERKKKDRNYSPESPVNFVLIFLCPMEDPGLSIWPTHRVVELPAAFEERVQRYFDVLPEKEFARLTKKESSPQPLLVCTPDGKCRTLVVKSKEILSKAMPGRCKAYRELGVSILHSLLLADVDPQKITYVKDEKETRRRAKAEKRAAVIVPATPIAAVKEIALADQTMPQKSTYFYPKVATGIVIHAFEE